MKDFKFLFEKYFLGQHGRFMDRRRYESEVQKILKPIKGKLFVDIGAHELFYSNLLSSHFDRVIAFEPNRNLKLKPKSNVEVVRTALSDEVGQSTFYCYTNHGLDGLIKGFDYWVTDRGYAPEQKGAYKGSIIDSFSVTVSTYDHVIREVADLVKIDVEGAEFKVLNGMHDFLPRNILIELHDERQRYQLQSKLWEMGYHNITKVDSNHIMGRIQ